MNDPDLNTIFVSSLDKDGSEKDQLVCIGKQLVKLLYISQINCSTHKLSGRTINVIMPQSSLLINCKKDVSSKCECSDIENYTLAKEIDKLKDNIINIAVHAIKHNIKVEFK